MLLGGRRRRTFASEAGEVQSKLPSRAARALHRPQQRLRWNNAGELAAGRCSKSAWMLP